MKSDTFTLSIVYTDHENVEMCRTLELPEFVDIPQKNLTLDMLISILAKELSSFKGTKKTWRVLFNSFNQAYEIFENKDLYTEIIVKTDKVS